MTPVKEFEHFNFYLESFGIFSKTFFDIVSPQGILPNHDNISKILQWPRPTTVTKVRQLLGMGSYDRKFLKGFAELLRPLIELTKKGKQFIWTDECENVFSFSVQYRPGP